MICKETKRKSVIFVIQMFQGPIQAEIIKNDFAGIISAKSLAALLQSQWQTTAYLKYDTKCNN